MIHKARYGGSGMLGAAMGSGKVGAAITKSGPKHGRVSGPLGRASVKIGNAVGRATKGKLPMTGPKAPSMRPVTRGKLPVKRRGII